jgi:hypothetical protein
VQQKSNGAGSGEMWYSPSNCECLEISPFGPSSAHMVAGRQWEISQETQYPLRVPRISRVLERPGTEHWSLSGKWSPRAMISQPRATLGRHSHTAGARVDGGILANKRGEY